MQAVDFEPIHTAFARLADRRYTQYTRTEQYDRAGRFVAMTERTIRIIDGRSDLISKDSAGRFAFGYLDRFVTSPGSDTDASQAIESIGKDEPPYLSPRNRDAYVYELAEDTLFGGRRVDVLDVEARPGESDGLAVRKARLYVERGSGRLLGLYMQRSDAALWYREASAYFVGIRQDRSGAWLPDRARFDTIVRLPFRPTQRFRRVLSFYNYGSTGSGR